MRAGRPRCRRVWFYTYKLPIFPSFLCESNDILHLKRYLVAKTCKGFFGRANTLFFFKCGFNVVAVVQSLSRVQLFVTPWSAAHQAPLYFTISQGLPKFMSFESGTPSNHLILCRLLLLLLSVFPSIRVFPNKSVLRIRWPKY